MLRGFLAEHHDAIIERALARMGARRPAAATGQERRDVSLFLGALSAALTLPSVSLDAGAFRRGATAHGAELVQSGFTVAEVVLDYGDISQAIAEIAQEKTADLSAVELQRLHRWFQEAMALAVTEHARQRERSITHDGLERLGELAHELRNSLGSALVSFDLLKTGTAGIGGSTAGVLGRSLDRLSALVSASLASVRLEAGIWAPERVSMRDFIEEVEAGATVALNHRDVTLAVTSVADGVDVEVDRPLLAAAVTNLLSNAFKFSRPRGHVLLRTWASADRVIIDVEDECGGLPPEKLAAPFRAFQQRGADRSGLGLGLSLSRKSVEANHGRMTVRDLPGVGCVFTIDLPRLLPGTL